MTQSAKRESCTKLHRGFPGTGVGVEELKTLIQEAAGDTGGGGYTPGIYRLIARCSTPNPKEGLRFSVTNACIEFVKKYLERANRGETAIFLMLLTRAELTGDAARLRDALFQYVDKHIGSISRDTADIAVLLLKRGVGQSNARTWLLVLRQQISTRPSWPVIDVLVEMTFLLENEYSRREFKKDLEHLRNTHDFRINVEARQHKWARLGMLTKEVLSDNQSSFTLDGEVDRMINSMAITQDGERSGTVRRKRPNATN